ncbi:hypothetical protein ACHAWF_008380 [Thalassiosira exigua]
MVAEEEDVGEGVDERLPDASLLALASDGDLPALIRRDPRALRRFRDDRGSSLLHYAAGSGRADVCRHLLRVAGVDANDRSVDGGRTALHWAARNGRTDVCRMLVLEHGASVDAPARGEVTPLELAIWQCQLETATCLVGELGADPHRPNAWGCTTAHWLGKSPMCDVEDGEATERLERVCDWLFGDCGVCYDRANHHGQTPLHKAAYAGNFVVAEYLCTKRGVLDDVRDDNGNTAADCAERSRNFELAKWLRRNASAEIHRAVEVLVLRKSDPSIVPSPEKLRAAYLNLARRHHPEVSDQCVRRWNSIRDAHELLQSWWREDSDHFDRLIRMLSRNRRLLEHQKLCWHVSWHERQRPTVDNDALAEFESRLVRLLSGESFLQTGLCLAQLPREYEKNFHAKVPSPRDYGCRKLMQLLRERCRYVNVETVDGLKKAVLQAADCTIHTNR